MCVDGSMRCIVGGKRRMETVTLPVRLVLSLSQLVSQDTRARHTIDHHPSPYGVIIVAFPIAAAATHSPCALWRVHM